MCVFFLLHVDFDFNAVKKVYFKRPVICLYIKVMLSFLLFNTEFYEYMQITKKHIYAICIYKSSCSQLFVCRKCSFLYGQQNTSEYLQLYIFFVLQFCWLEQRKIILLMRSVRKAEYFHSFCGIYIHKNKWKIVLLHLFEIFDSGKYLMIRIHICKSASGLVFNN